MLSKSGHSVGHDISRLPPTTTTTLLSTSSLGRYKNFFTGWPDTVKCKVDFQVLKATLVVVAIHFKIVRNFSPKTIIMSFTHKRQNVEKNWEQSM